MPKPASPIGALAGLPCTVRPLSAATVCVPQAAFLPERFEARDFALDAKLACVLSTVAASAASAALALPDCLEAALLLRDGALLVWCETLCRVGAMKEDDVEARAWLCCRSVAVSSELRDLAGEEVRDAAFACFLCNLLSSISLRRA